MDFYSQITRNKRMTYVLFLIFFILIGFLAYIVSFVIDWYFGAGFIFFYSIFGVLTIIFAIASYYSSDKIVTSISKAKEAPVAKFKQLHNIVEELCVASGLPKPKIFVMDDTAINAFATGRNPEHAVVCVTMGCLTRLNRAQLQGVIAHELSHIKSYDVRTMTIATVLVGITVLLSDMIFRTFFYGSLGGSNSRDSGGLFFAMLGISIILAILTPIIAKMITFTISRKREFSADAAAVQLTRNPEGLATALEVIEKDTEKLEAANKATAHLYISNPLRGQKLLMKSLFSTHPPLKERIQKIRGH